MYKYVVLLFLVCIAITPLSSRVYALETTTISVTADSSVFSGKPDLNRGSADYLYVGETTHYPSTKSIARTWLKFDLSSLPEDIVITKAELWVYFEQYQGDGAAGGIAVYFSSDDTWAETGITWNNQPSFEGSASDAIPQFTGWNQWKKFNVTTDVQNEYAGDKVVSWCLRAVNEPDSPTTGWDNNVADSKEGSTQYAPYLYIEYEITPQFVIPLIPFGTAVAVALGLLAFGIIMLSKRNGRNIKKWTLH